MGLGQLFARDLQYTATNTDTGASATFMVVDGIAPDWDSGAYRGGMSIPGAWRAALMISDLLGSVPWHAYRERADRPAERVSPTPLMLERPSPPDVRMTTFSSWGLDLVWEGNAVGIVAARNREGWPTAYLPVPARNVLVKRVERWDQSPLPVGTIVYRIGNRDYAPYDVLHVKGPCEPGALRGMGVLEHHLHTTLDLAREQARAARTVGTAGVPTGVLKSTDPDFDEEDARDLKTSWHYNQRERSVAVLNATTDFTPLAWNPEETQLLEARRFSLHEIALIFGLPLYFLGADQNSRTYSNQEQEGINLLRWHLNGHLTRFEQTLSAHMPDGTWAKANLDVMLRPDTLARYQAHAVAITNGFLTRDEVRELEDRPPLTPAQRAELTAPAPRPAAPAPDDQADDPADDQQEAEA